MHRHTRTPSSAHAAVYLLKTFQLCLSRTSLCISPEVFPCSDIALSSPTLDVLTCVQQPRAFCALHATLPVYVLPSLTDVLFLSALPGELLCSLDRTCSLRRISHFLVRFSGLAHCGHVVLTSPFSLCSSWLQGPDCINFLFLGTQSGIYGTSWALSQCRLKIDG